PSLLRFLELAHTLSQLRQTRKQRILLLELRQRPRRRPPDNFFRADRLAIQHSRLPAYDGLVLNTAVIPKSRLPANQHVVTNVAASRNPSLRRNYRVLPDPNVVRHMNQVIELHSILNSRNTQRPSRDSRVIPNFHVVADLNASELRKFPVSPLAINVSETISPDHGARMQRDATSNSRPGIERYPRMQPARFPNDCSLPDKTKRSNFGMRANHSLGLNHCVWPHARIRRQFRQRVDHRSGMDSSRNRLRLQ